MTELTSTHYIVLLQALTNAPARVAEVMAALSVEAYEWQPTSDTWSISQTLAHLAASDPPFKKRLISMTQAHNPWLPYFGPDVARPDVDAPAPELLARFRDSRAALLDFLAGLAPEDWERLGVHETMGPTTLAQQVQNIVNHDTEHLGQLYELRQAWQYQPHV
jgi:uncharacterized damage-inducible protein DinB